MAILEKAAAKLKKWDFEADVVVVGYGGAGGCAAIAGHDVGVKTLILEKAPVGGGNTGCSGGLMAIPSDMASAIEYYKHLLRGGVDEEWIPALAEAMVGLPHRLGAWGARFNRGPVWPLYPVYPGSNSIHRTTLVARSARQTEDRGPTIPGIPLFNFLNNQAKKRGIEVMYETPAKELIQDPVTKEILGVRAESSAGEIHVKAKRGVVLACGGFQNNKEMLVNFLAYTSELPIYPFGTPYNTGDGILMATEVGAKLWHMTSVEWGTFSPKVPAEKFGVGFRFGRLPVDSQAIYVNKYGKRFMDDAVWLSHRRDLFKVQYWDHERAEYPNIPFYMVFDETYRKRGPIVGTGGSWWNVHKLYKWSSDNSAEIEQGWIVKGNTIKELAERMGIDSTALAETISKYNEYCRRGEDPEFGRAKEWLARLETPPYYATELCEPIINTQGGPKHNTRAEVLDRNDKPIPRLYAAGELGSFFSPLYQSGSNVPEALALGIIAGEQAAALTPWG